MNDFIDGATTHTAYELSKARFAGQTTVPTTAVTAQVTSSKSKSARDQLKRAQGDLKKNQDNEGLLQSVVSKQGAALEVKGVISNEDKSAMGVLRDATKEAEDTRKAQEEVLKLAKQRVAATETPTEPGSNITPAKSPGDQLTSAQTDLQKNKEKETLLQAIVAKHATELDVKEYVADEEISALHVLKAAKKEAEEIRKAQEEVLELAKKRVSEEKQK